MSEQTLPIQNSVDAQEAAPLVSTAKGTAAHQRLGFRPDVEGIRAIAVLVVVLYHSHVPGFRGGFVGVDVFFVISGFLITSLLLREREKSGTISISDFYGRRARRILPASALMVIVTIWASYHWLGFLRGNTIAGDAKWTSIFAANLHFAAIGTSYLGSQAPPSTLQHMWSLGVEEQFYVVWPTMFYIAIRLGSKDRARLRLGIVLGILSVASLALSVAQTSSNATAAYFSPFVRAWELAAGAMVAVAMPAVRRLPSAVAGSLSMAGLTAIVLANLVYSDSTQYPGLADALPVIGTAALIAGGSATSGPIQSMLATHPFQWLGKRSYSLYLWHWPLLIIPMEYAGHQLPVLDNLGWVGLALVIAAVSYRFVENPIRRSRWLSSRSMASMMMGVTVVAVTIAVASVFLAQHHGSTALW